MLEVDIYQTLENRQNEEEIKKHGPYLCSSLNSDGSRKRGKMEPWLGEGYYFWDTRIGDAKWWGDTVYKERGYIVCHTKYDQHSPLLYDLVGNIALFEQFVNYAQVIKDESQQRVITVATVVWFLRKQTSFKYKAIRMWPSPQDPQKTGIVFCDSKYKLIRAEKIQICFFDKTLLTRPYEIICTQIPMQHQTI